MDRDMVLEDAKPLTEDQLKQVALDMGMTETEWLEETIGSIDYNVWVTADRSNVEIIAYHSKLSRYVGCPKCSTKAFHKVSSKVIRSPTYSSQEKNYVNVKTADIEKLKPIA